MDTSLEKTLTLNHAAYGVSINWPAGKLTGETILKSRKVYADLKALFVEQQNVPPPDQEIYRVEWYAPAPTGKIGGLLWGVTHLQPGTVGDEYFMTHGHFHADSTRDEYYIVASGKGLLLQMDRSGHTWAQEMPAGSISYIDGKHAHRVVNVGDESLVFWACWGTDAGYDYDTIARDGFGLRVMKLDGKPVLVGR